MKNGRHILAILTLAALMPAALCQAQTKKSELDTFIFSPQWSAQAQFAGYYVAKEKGFYEEEGLDVQIVHPFSTQTAEDRLRRGVSHAATLTLTEAMSIVDDGLPLVNILQTSMNSAILLVSRYGGDPMKLRGAKVVTWRAGFGQTAKCIASQSHLSYQWITAASCVNLFIAGAVDATLAMSYNEYNQLLQTGLIKPGEGVYRFSEHGFNIQEDGVYMTRTAFNRSRSKAEAFARASRRGWEWAAEHPEETLEIVMEYVRSMRIPTNRILQSLMLDEILRLQLDPDTGTRDFRLRPDMVRQASGLMAKEGLLSREVKYEELLP